MDFSFVPIVFIVAIAFYLVSSIKILAEYERGVIFRLGRVRSQPKGPGVILVFRPASIAWCACRCASKPWRCPRRTWSPAITSRSRSTP